jgi:hypothetical protein
MAAANVMVCRHFFVVGVDSDENYRLAFLGHSHYNARICPNHPPLGDVGETSRVPSDPVLFQIVVVFWNVSACVGKEVNANATETAALSMTVDLKDADSSDAVGTDRSI